MKFTPTFKLKYKSKLSNFLKLRITPLFKTAGEVSQVVRSCQQGLVMALKRQRRARIFQERRNVFEIFGDEQLIKQVTFPQLFKTSKEHLHYQRTS